MTNQEIAALEYVAQGTFRMLQNVYEASATDDEWIEFLVKFKGHSYEGSDNPDRCDSCNAIGIAIAMLAV